MNPDVGTLAIVVLDAMHALVPASRHSDRPWGDESRDAVHARYQAISRDLATVCLDPKESPIRGMTRAQTCGMLLGLAVGESGLSRDTDEGPCYREGGWAARCDRGRSASMWQLQVGPGREWRGELVTTERLFADRKLAIRVALGAVHASLGKCRHLPAEYRLSAYGAGVCVRLEGAADRWRTGQSAIGLIDAGLRKAIEGQS